VFVSMVASWKVVSIGHLYTLIFPTFWQSHISLLEQFYPWMM
jgi:hypothetical protein